MWNLNARTRKLTDHPLNGEYVLVWIRTAVRGFENPLLDVALETAHGLGLPVFVYHAVSERYRYASNRHHTFILEGARDLSRQLAERGIGYAFHCERPGHRGPHLETLGRRAAVLLTEEMPVSPLRNWTRALAERLETTPVWTVDTACVVPMRLIGKPYTRAFQYRKALKPHLEKRLHIPWVDVAPRSAPFVPDGLPFEPVDLETVSIPELVALCDIDPTVGPVPHTPGGSEAGYARWSRFLEKDIRGYAARRNDPNRHGVSRLSAYLHYGMVAPTRIAREARAVGGKGAEKYLDELIVWREMAYTWCLYQRHHETLDALPGWARETLEARAADPRPALYPREALERGDTGNLLWDTAQASLRIHGELHNNLRMTWGKALVGWTPGPREALDVLVDLNHRYALDGRDPASYGGLLWCLGGFDRPFDPERPVWGRVRGRSVERHAGRLDVERWRAHVHRPLGSRRLRVAVIGAGPAGALCARTLADHGVEVVVFDKARGAGGRMSTRRAEGGLRFDHGAQYFTVRDRHLARRAAMWAETGVIAPWEAKLGTLVGGVFSPRSSDEARYVGTPGMNGLVKHLLSGLDVRWSTRITALDEVGDVDAVVVAIPAPQAVALLGDVPELRARIEAVKVAPCWAVMATFEGVSDVDWGGARVEGSPLSWVARNQTKPGRAAGETWVLHASPAWSREHLEAAPEAVVGALVGALREQVSVGETLHAAAHRWRYALVEEAVGEPCLWDAERGVGVCGDGLLGGRVESALISGAAMAGRVLGALLEGTEA